MVSRSVAAGCRFLADECIADGSADLIGIARQALDEAGVRKTPDGRRRLVAPEWAPDRRPAPD